MNAIAALDLYKAPCIIVDFGTATTYCYLNEKGDYMGGAIAPGITISTEALYTQAARLPRIEIVRPTHIVGKTTVSLPCRREFFMALFGQVEGMC